MSQSKSNKKAIFIMIVITFLLLLKVYIANETYFISRDIQKITANINALKEERNILKLKIEKLKYKNQIIDPLYIYKPKDTNQENLPPVPKIKEEKKVIHKKKPKKVKAKKKQSTKELFETLETEEAF